MTKQFRPMLGIAATLAEIQYPIIASPKLDGIRCICLNGEIVSRTLKPIPNVRTRINLPKHHGWDGELIVGLATAPNCYQRTVSNVMTQDAPFEATWWLFDDFSSPENDYLVRIEKFVLHSLEYDRVKMLEHRALWSESELLTYEEHIVGQGYEGLILRHPNGKYKYGRSTMREQGMLKLKRFVDDDATVVDFEELMHNANDAKLDERGYTKRSSHQEHKVGTNTLGSLVVEWRGQHLRLGTGFTANDRVDIWKNRSDYIGKLAKFKYLPVGMKDLPRHPVFLGWRHPDDV